MSTTYSLAQNDEEAKDMVGAFKNRGFKNIALVGPDTSLTRGPTKENAKWIVIASNEAITLGKTEETADKDKAEEVIKDGKDKPPTDAAADADGEGR